MSQRFVKILFDSGEEITFLEPATGEFPSGEYKAWKYPTEMRAWFDDVDKSQWYADAVEKAQADGKQVLSIKWWPKQAEAPSYVGLTRDQAHDRAIEQGVNFRVVWDDHVEHLDTDDANRQRVSVYVLDDRVIRAEYY